MLGLRLPNESSDGDTSLGHMFCTLLSLAVDLKESESMLSARSIMAENTSLRGPAGGDDNDDSASH